MNTDSLNKWLTLLANIGVIAGIVFLALELQQNNELLAAQARKDQLEARTSTGNLILNNPEVASVRYKAISGEQLTPEEQELFRMFVLIQLVTISWQYAEFRAGHLSELPIASWRASFQIPLYLETYRSSLGLADNDFTQYIEENVLND